MIVGNSKYEYSWRIAVLPYFGDESLSKLESTYKYDEPWNGPSNKNVNLPQYTSLRGLYHCPNDSSPDDQASYLSVAGEETMFPRNKKVMLVDTAATQTSVSQAGKKGLPSPQPIHEKPSIVVKEKVNTILFVESHNSGIHWREPRDLRYSEAVKPINSKDSPSISSSHPSGWPYTGTGANVAFVDGEVRWLNSNIDPKLLRSLLEIDNPDKPKEKFISP